MYEATSAQVAAESKLMKQGFRFGNWISAFDGDETHGCMVMVKRSKGRSEYREIDPSGEIH